jgi:hypothetical protein
MTQSSRPWLILACSSGSLNLDMRYSHASSRRRKAPPPSRGPKSNVGGRSSERLTSEPSSRGPNAWPESGRRSVGDRDGQERPHQPRIIPAPRRPGPQSPSTASSCCRHRQFLWSLHLQPERLDQIPELEVVPFHELAQLLGAAGFDLQAARLERLLELGI